MLIHLDCRWTGLKFCESRPRSSVVERQQSPALRTLDLTVTNGCNAGHSRPWVSQFFLTQHPFAGAADLFLQWVTFPFCSHSKGRKSMTNAIRPVCCAAVRLEGCWKFRTHAGAASALQKSLAIAALQQYQRDKPPQTSRLIIQKTGRSQTGQSARCYLILAARSKSPIARLCGCGTSTDLSRIL